MICQNFEYPFNLIFIKSFEVSPGFIESISTSSTFKPISSSNVGDDTSNVNLSYNP